MVLKYGILEHKNPIDQCKIIYDTVSSRKRNNQTDIEIIESLTETAVTFSPHYHLLQQLIEYKDGPTFPILLGHSIYRSAVDINETMKEAIRYIRHDDEEEISEEVLSNPSIVIKALGHASSGPRSTRDSYQMIPAVKKKPKKDAPLVRDLVASTDIMYSLQESYPTTVEFDDLYESLLSLTNFIVKKSNLSMTDLNEYCDHAVQSFKVDGANGAHMEMVPFEEVLKKYETNL